MWIKVIIFASVESRALYVNDSHMLVRFEHLVGFLFYLSPSIKAWIIHNLSLANDKTNEVVKSYEQNQEYFSRIRKKMCAPKCRNSQRQCPFRQDKADLTT